MPQLAIVLRRNAGDVPEALRAAGSRGERHVATLVSLAAMGPATVGELGQRLGMTHAHASLVVGELAKAGLVERDHDPDDRRRIVVSVSERAGPALAEMRARGAAPLRRFLARLEEDEAHRFIDQLALLLSILRGDEQA
jgi:DNA-binding MarR family transcriptional regulator